MRHMMFLQSENYHVMQLADLFSLSLKNKSSSLYIVQIYILNNKKINLTSHVKYMSVV